MSISSISSTSSSAYSTVNNDDEVTQLKKQWANLMQELQKVQQSKNDEKTKQQETNLIQMQIQQIEAQIRNASSTSTTNTQSTDNSKGSEQFLTDAASVLGMSADDLKTQLQSGSDLLTIVEDQGLTVDDFQQQMTKLGDNGQVGPPPPPPGKGPEQFLTDAASVLGISADDLKTQLQAGSNLQTIVEDQGLTVDDFQQQMTELRDNGQASPPPPLSEKEPEQFLTDAASVLGISTDDLKTQLQADNDLQTIIEEQGLTIDDFQQQMTALFNSHQSSNVDQIGYFINQAI